MQTFGELISDNNPIHQSILPEKQSSEAQSILVNKPQIVHAMLTGSIFSSIFGTLIPGSIYRSQILKFHSPVYSNEKVLGRVVVTKVKDMKSRGTLVTCDTNVYKNHDWSENIEDCDDIILCISGEANVWLPKDSLCS